MDLIEAKKQPTVVSLPHPLRADAKEVSVAAFLPNETLGAYIERVGLRIAKGPVHVWHNGYRVPEALWTRLIPRNGDSIVIRAKMEGGGGGSKILRTVAMIALVVASMWVPQALGLTTTLASGATALSVGGMALSAAIMIGGGMLINSLLPPPKPSLPKARDSKYQTSPSYSISGGRNRIRELEPMILVFGRHRVVPDLGARPYADWETSWEKGIQYFNQVFHFGLQAGQISLSDFRIGDTPVGRYRGVTTQVSGENGKLSLLGSVHTIDGFAAKYNVPHIFTTPENTTRITINYAFQLYSIKTNGGRVGINMQVDIRYRRVGTSTWTTITRSHNSATTFTHYSTSSFNVPAGEYEVYVRKATADYDPSDYRPNTTRYASQLQVLQIQCRLQDPGNYSGQQRVGLRIQATDQLNGVVDEFSAIASARAPVWTGSAWQTRETSNPAWWFLWFARGKVTSQGRLYGAGLADWQIDIEAIKAWAAWCDAKRLTFNYVLDRNVSSAEVLQTIARAGRASPTWQSGKLGVVWDAADLPHVAMFGPFNVKAGTFQVDYINEGTVDEIVVTFMNADTWKLDEVRVKVPGATVTHNPLQLDLEGCTDVDMAGREANLIAASQVWHRRRISWETDIEGWVVNRGDVVQFSHDLTVWGYSGRLTGRSGNSVVLDKSVPSDGSGTLMLRGPEGQMRTVAVLSDVGDVDTLTVTSDTSGFPLPGDEGYEDIEPMDWAWFFDPLATPGRRFKVIHVEPVGSDSVRFQAIDDDPGYYASENNPYIHVPPRDGQLLAGIVFDITPIEGWYNTLTGTVDVEFTWSISSTMDVDVLISVNDKALAPIKTQNVSTVLEGLRRDDEVTITVVPTPSAGAGTPATLTYTVKGEASPPDPIDSVSWTVEGAQLLLNWKRSAFADVIGYEVRDTDSNWGDDGYLFRGDALSCLVAPGEVGVEKTWYVRPFNAGGLYAEASATTVYTTPQPDDPSSVTATFEDTSLTTATVTLDWGVVEPVFGLDYYRVSYGSVVKLAKSTTITLPADWIGNREFTIQTVDMLGNASPGLVTNIEKLAPLPPTSVRAQVIDNNVLLYWALPDRTTLPIDHVLVKEGETWATGREVGTKKGSFTSLSELTPGQKRYWLATVDTDGWESDPVSIVANVSEPPDFIFRGEIQSELDGTLTNGVREGGEIVMPVNTTETWQQHFGDRSWGSPQDQVDDGYPVYIQPTPTPGIYVEEFDFGTVVPSSRVDVSLTGTVEAGNPTIEQTVQTSQDGITWSEPTSGTSVFATTFRYVRYTLRVIQANDRAAYRVNAIVARLSTKLKNDGGNTDCLASDPNGTIANFNATFIDVSSLTLTPAGTSPKTAVYDFKDSALSGTYSIVSGVATVNVNGHGLLPGQDVMLLYANREPQRATVQTATANSFTALVDGPNKSGNLQIYSQSMRIYLFDANGNRASGSVSWAIKGN